MGMLPLWIWAWVLLQGVEPPAPATPKSVILATATAQDMNTAQVIAAEMKQRGLLAEAWQLRGIHVLNQDANAWHTWLETKPADVVVIVGVAGTLAAADPDFSLPVPVISGFFHDPGLFDFSYTAHGRSGKPQLNFVIPAPRLSGELQRFARLIEGNQLAVVMDAALANAFPAMKSRLQDLGDVAGLKLNWIAAAGDGQNLLEQIGPHVDGVLLGPLANYSDQAQQDLMVQLNAAGLPTYAMAGLTAVAQGAFAGSAQAPQQKLARRIVDHLTAYASGQSLADLPAYLPIRDVPTINGASALNLGTSLSLEARMHAEVVFYDQDRRQPQVSFAEVIALGLAHNPELEAQKFTTAAADHQKKAARGMWLPQVSAESQITRNNSDNPLIAAGLSAETQSQVVVSGQQVIFDEATLAETRIATWEWQRQVAQLDQRSQETLQAVAFAYLNLGIEKQLLEVDLENLRLTRSNLQVAKTRVALGSAGREEQLRWESLEALQTGQVYAAQARLQAAQASLERLLGRPLEIPWYERTAHLQPHNTLFLQDSWHQLRRQYGETLVQVLTEMASARSPQVRASELQTKVARRRFTQSKRSFFLPSVRLNASLTDIFDQEFQPRMADNPGFSLQQDGANWNVTLQASIPLFNGGRRVQQLGTARANQRSAEAVLRSNHLAAEERVRKALANFDGSHPNVELTVLAADRARASLDLTLAKYEQGLVSTLDIQQVQEQAMSQQRQAAIAKYNHLANLIELQTSLSFFDWQLGEADRTTWLAAIKQKLEYLQPVSAQQNQGARDERRSKK